MQFFPADGSAPRDYQSPRTQEAFIEYINNEAGTHRTAGGLLDDLAGRIPSLDALATTFLSSSADARTAVIAQAQELANSLTGSTNTAEKSAASYYLKVMDKISQSNDWAANEVARLQKMATKRGTMAGKQLDDLQVRIYSKLRLTWRLIAVLSSYSDTPEHPGCIHGRQGIGFLHLERCQCVNQRRP